MIIPKYPPLKSNYFLSNIYCIIRDRQHDMMILGEMMCIGWGLSKTNQNLVFTGFLIVCGKKYETNQYIINATQLFRNFLCEG